MAFGKKNDERKDETTHDYLRFPMGTRITATPNGKLSISFAGDVSIGETLPELGELTCGRNLSFDPGVTLKSDRIEAKNELEISPGCKLTVEQIKAEKLICKRSTLETKRIDTLNLECESTNITAEFVTVKETVFLDKGELEIGTLTADSLTLAKGTLANIMIADVNKLDGGIQKGGYANFKDLLLRLYKYRPELLNDKFSAEAKRLLNIKDEPSTPAAVLNPGMDNPAPVVMDVPFADDVTGEPTQITRAKLREQMDVFRQTYSKSDMPKEVGELCGFIENNDVDSLKKNLNSCYQRLAVHKIPNEVMEIFYNIQRILKEDSRLRREQSGKS